MKITRRLSPLLMLLLVGTLSASRAPFESRSFSWSAPARAAGPAAPPVSTADAPLLTPTNAPASPQPAVLPQASLLPPTQTSPAPTPTPVLEPLVFPTPPPAAITTWRPPLYPVPWALAPYDHFLFTRPVAADEVNWPLPDYRYGGVFLPGVVHTGIDIPAPSGTPVLAAGSGRVTWVGYGLYYGYEKPDDPYGLAVAVKHDFGYQNQTLYTVYGHLSEAHVRLGQIVKTGDLIGLTGETGKVTGPHLHFEVRVGKNNFFGSRNPELWLAPPQGWGILAARVMTTAGQLLRGQAITVRSLETEQVWSAVTYGKDSVNSDPYYRENLVLGDLPAGDYVVWIPYAGSTYDLNIHITPGTISYFTFRGKNGYKTDLPPLPGSDFSPAELLLLGP